MYLLDEASHGESNGGLRIAVHDILTKNRV